MTIEKIRQSGKHLIVGIGSALVDLLVSDMAGTTHYRSKVTMGEMGANKVFLQTAEPRQRAGDSHTLFFTTRHLPWVSLQISLIEAHPLQQLMLALHAILSRHFREVQLKRLVKQFRNILAWVKRRIRILENHLNTFA